MTDAYDGGYVCLQVSGGNIRVKFDSDGGANSFTTLATVQGAAVTTANASL